LRSVPVRTLPVCVILLKQYTCNWHYLLTHGGIMRQSQIGAKNKSTSLVNDRPKSFPNDKLNCWRRRWRGYWYVAYLESNWLAQ
jgi:hypothetical protein